MEVPSWICSYSLKHMCWSRWNVKLSESLSLSVSEPLKIAIKEGINFFCSLLALQWAGEMGWGVHWVLSLPEGVALARRMLLVPSWGSHRWVLPPSCLWNFPEFPAGLFLADPRRCPLWTSYPTSWFHTKSSHNGLLDSCLWILPLFLDPLLQFSSGISCVLSVLDFSLYFFSLLWFLPELFYLQT